LTNSAPLPSSPVVAEGEEAVEGLADTGNIGVDLLVGQQTPCFVAARRIADLGGAAAHQDDGAMAGLLHPVQHHDRHQIADMQAVGGGVVTHIGGNHGVRCKAVERIEIGALVQVSPLADDLQEI
jgi:hypothetical protein